MSVVCIVSEDVVCTSQSIHCINDINTVKGSFVVKSYELLYCRVGGWREIILNGRQPTCG